MSPRLRVVTGVDDRGRPKTEWETAEVEPPPYGFMEPAIAPTIARRQATPAELEAARAREVVHHLIPVRPPLLSKPSTPEQAAARPAGRRSPMGSAKNMPRLIEEEAVVSEERPNIPQIIPDASTHERSPLERLAKAALAAHEAALVFDRARAVRSTALADLEEAAAACGLAVVPATTSIPSGAIAVVETTNGAAHDPTEVRTTPARHQSKAERARRVMSAMERHDGDQRAVAAELGMRANAVAMVVKHARARAEALPA